MQTHIHIWRGSFVRPEVISDSPSISNLSCNQSIQIKTIKWTKHIENSESISSVAADSAALAAQRHSSIGTGTAIGSGNGVRYLFALFYLSSFLLFAFCYTLIHALFFTPFPWCV